MYINICIWHITQYTYPSGKCDNLRSHSPTHVHVPCCCALSLTALFLTQTYAHMCEYTLTHSHALTLSHIRVGIAMRTRAGRVCQLISTGVCVCVCHMCVLYVCVMWLLYMSQLYPHACLMCVCNVYVIHVI